MADMKGCDSRQSWAANVGYGELRLGHNSLVGTTVKQADHLPSDVLADEKHTWLNDQKVYAATTVGNDCGLGASIALSADADHLQADYQPKTVNTDGWQDTRNAWQALFPNIATILCFLHGFLTIRDRCKRLKAHFQMICTRVWECYTARGHKLRLGLPGFAGRWHGSTPPKDGDFVHRMCRDAIATTQNP